MKVIANHGYIKDQNALKSKRETKSKVKEAEIKINDINIAENNKKRHRKEVKERKPFNSIPVITALSVLAVSGWATAGYLHFVKPTVIYQVVDATPTAGVINEGINFAVQDNIVENESETKDTIVEATSSESEEYLDNANILSSSESIQEYYYNLIPEKYRNLFETSGYTWEVYEGDLEALVGSSTQEYIDNDNQIVYINSKDDAAIIHAVGTFLYENYIKSDATFNDVFDTESMTVKKEFSTFYNASYEDIDSFAAAGFYLYVIKPNKLYTTSQSTYMYFKNMQFITNTASNE